jgi:hypothetical protein
MMASTGSLISPAPNTTQNSEPQGAWSAQSHTQNLRSLDLNALLVTAQEAQKELRMLEHQLAELYNEHTTRTGMQKLKYINEQPDLKHTFPH